MELTAETVEQAIAEMRRGGAMPKCECDVVLRDVTKWIKVVRTANIKAIQ